MLDQNEIQVSEIPVQVVRKDIKHLHIGVYPPAGRVRVATPLRLNDEAVRLAVTMRIGWIRKQQKQYQDQARQSRREMVSGESHYFQGKRYRLDVIRRDGPAEVRIANQRLELRVPTAYDRDQRAAVLREWYRQRLKALIPGLLAKWEPRVGQKAADVRIRKMKTRWGSCKAGTRRILLNLELAKKSPESLEYVLVHELVHLQIGNHGRAFEARMDSLLPTWRIRKAELNRAPLSYEIWKS